MGGTKVVCGAGSTPDHIAARHRIATTDPASTLDAVGSWIAATAADLGPPTAIGVATFGPIDRDRASPHWGRITDTPKPGWSGTDVVGALETNAPVAFETDVNGAAVGEYRFGAGRGARTLVYVTVGTGVGAGVVVDGVPTPGLGHPEFGHVRPRRDAGDPFGGVCPFHGDCLEGLVSGPALAARFGSPAEHQPADSVVEAVAPPLARALTDLVYALAPDRILVGGGVGLTPGLHEAVGTKLVELLGGYAHSPRHDVGFVVPPELGGDAGLVGALCLAEAAS